MSSSKFSSFELKSGSVDLLLFVVKTAELDTLRVELIRRFEATPEFFANDVVAIDVRRLADGEQVALPDVAKLLESVRMRPMGVIAQASQEWAMASGLPLLEARDRRVVAREKTVAPAAPEKASATAGAEKNGTPAKSALPKTEEVVSKAPVQEELPMMEPDRVDDVKPQMPASEHEHGHEYDSAATTVPVTVTGRAGVVDTVSAGADVLASTLVIDRPLRSGQRIYAKGDVVMLALVSHGAEVIAEGNIHIYASLRGRALAGVQGDTRARIFCTCLEAELVSIAGIYRTIENPLPPDIQGKPVQIRLDDEKLLIEPMELT